VAVALGSNLGDRLHYLRTGIHHLSQQVADLRSSSVYESEPVGVTEQPRFLNACCVGVTALKPREILGMLKEAERVAGRRRKGPRFGPRVLDLDLLLFGDLTLNGPELTIPHPRMRERAFVLVPLAEIAAEWVVPGGAEGGPDATVRELAERVDRSGVHVYDPPAEDAEIELRAEGAP
jgi:2-amino-4-hydroxy-6-hydroxymethyldihydropteridine diphosphokinase